MCLPVHPFRVEREWIHAGLKCAVVQAREASHRCAYVRVPPTHPLYGKGCNDINPPVHGGITYAQMEDCTEEDGVGWWFGFDFAHCGDALYDPNPDMAALSPDAKAMLAVTSRIRRESSLAVYGKVVQRDEHFWTQAEVERECEELAEHLAEGNFSGSPKVVD
jgi:hypothetical protein